MEHYSILLIFEDLVLFVLRWLCTQLGLLGGH